MTGDPTLSQTPSSLVRAPRVRELRVLFSVDTATPARVALVDKPVTVGREPGPDGVRLEDRRVSRVHLVVAPGANKTWSAIDQGSRNGIYVEGEKVASAVLAPGSVIRLGGTVLLYTENDQHHELDGVGAITGSSQVMRELRAEVGLAATRPQPVLVTGETGVGKERVAAELHRLSGRRGAFVPVNCAGISPSVAESELFGHVAGAFTGAAKRGEGLWAAANHGTLFLDEIGELSLELQAKLLRALALGEVRPVGATQATALDVRVVAATLRDLDADAAAGRFRADLLARLAGWRVVVPPLRARRDDVIELAELFLAPSAPVALTADVAEALVLYDWPWNVRELEQVIGVAVARAVQAGTHVIGLEHLPAAVREPLVVRAAGESAPDPASAPAPSPAPDALDAGDEDAPTADALTRALLQHACNISAVARIFNKERRQIYRWIERHRLDLHELRRRS